MRYLFSINAVGNGDRNPTAVIINENDANVILLPHREAWTKSKDTWRFLRQRKKDNPPTDGDEVFEICENQFRKFKEQGIIPINVDW